MTRRRPRWLAVTIALACVGGSYLVAATVPGEELREAAFATTGVPGDTVTGSRLEVALDEVALADEVRAEEWRGTTNGVWLVATVRLAAVAQRESPTVELEVDGIRFEASGREDEAVVDGTVVDPLLPRYGAVLVEFPVEVLDRDGARVAVLRFLAGGDSRLDSAVEFRIDLTDLERSPVIELPEPREIEP